MNDRTYPLDVNGAIQAIISERRAQIRKWGSRRDLDEYEFLAVLTEEVGEVAKNLNDQEFASSRTSGELIQIAAVCLAWLTGDVPIPVDSVRLGHLR